MNADSKMPDGNSGARATSAETKRRTRSLSRSLVDLTIELRKEPNTVFDVVIVGSGYGGSIAAQQLAGMKTTNAAGEHPRNVSICVLERGSEYLPGMFPLSFGELPGHTRYSTQSLGKVTGNLEGLFDLRLGEDVSALVANGLGGGSLINAGVMLKPDSASLAKAFPEAVARDLENTYLDKARSLVLAGPLALTAPNVVEKSPLYADPGGRPALPLKFQRLSDLAGAAPTANGHTAHDALDTRPAEISVALAPQACTPLSVNLSACVACGDCMTGCNVGAKASLDTNLLAQAARDGAAIYTGASVLALSRTPTENPETNADKFLWTLEVVHTNPSLRRREAETLKVKARKVILAAGTLGSPEILLRSRTAELAFSNMLGERFSCNGDNIAALHQLARPAHCTDDQHRALDERRVGPTITNMVKVAADEKQPGFWVQEFSVPAPLKRLFAELVTTGHSLSRLQTADCSLHGMEKDSALDPCAVDEDAMERTLLVGLIGHDSASGVLQLRQAAADANLYAQEGTVQIVWPEARTGQYLTAAYELFKAHAKAVFPGASIVANPMWRLLPDKLENLVSQPLGPVLTVHPLGGCFMGTPETPGVVDELGRVLDLRNYQDDPWQGSLVVLDGSIIAGSLGANPSLTISALALRAVEGLRDDWGFLPVEQPAEYLAQRPIFAAPQPAKTAVAAETRIKVMERLGGHVPLKVGAFKTEKFYVELTLAYEEVALQQIMSAWGGRKLKIEPDASCIRIFKSGVLDPESRRYDYDTLRFADDGEKERFAVFKAPLSGSLQFLHREQSHPIVRVFRGLRSYFCNRGKRDLWQEVTGTPQVALTVAGNAPTKKRTGFFAALWKGIGVLADLLRLASRAGEVRRFDYLLKVGTPMRLVGSGDDQLAKAFAGQTIAGDKRLTYNRRANPWLQLTRLKLTRMPLLASGNNDILKLDAPFLARQGVPLFQLTKQQNQPEALLDMASFALFMMRVMLNIHLWTFRKPDHAGKSHPKRLPGDIDGLPKPEITKLPLGWQRKSKLPGVVRLTRYAQPINAPVKLPPLVMIHGYSVSGTTFTHPSLAISAAKYFWLQGRDVWIVDLRTSAGMRTASAPWSIEEVALVDIPAALLHIKNLTGERVDVIAHCIGAAMMGMALLTDALDVKESAVELGVDTWITTGQLGTLAAFNGAGGIGQKHPTVRSVVLSQKGPLLRYTEGNIFRAYLMRSLRRWLVPEGYRFEPLSEPKVTDQLLDRLLSSLPYPDSDYDIENPFWPWQTTPWTATRHRMDALYGRDFAAGNLKNETLSAINDLFGPINLDTVSETIHFVRFSCVTNQRGRGEFVRLDNLRKRWSGIPTLAIHGAGNGLVDVSTQTLLGVNFRAAGVPFEKFTYPDLEHQDVWIGKTSENVFKEIEGFLKTPPTASPPAADELDWRFDPPWIGPRLRGNTGGVEVLALSAPRYGDAYLLLVPVARRQMDDGERLVQAGEFLKSEVGDSRAWLKLEADLASIGQAGDLVGWLAVIAHPFGQTTLTEPFYLSSKATEKMPSRQYPRAAGRGPMTPFQSPFKRLSKDVRQIFESLLEPARRARTTSQVQSPPMPITEPLNRSGLERDLQRWLDLKDVDFQTCFISRESIARLYAPAPSSFTFGLGSCQYPAGLVDGKIAHDSLTQLAKLAEEKGEKALDFMIFTGDQIYADATAGLVDPVRTDERFDLPYEMALRTAPMRRIMRCVPTWMMLDDHEIVDNWEPAWQSDKSAARLKRLRRQGVKAFWKYQRMDDHRASSPSGLRRSLSLTFDHGCASFYLLDTRSRRRHRAPGDKDASSLLFPQDMARLKRWLRKNQQPVKFIVSPSIVLPRHLGALNDGAGCVAESDGWEGYPGNLRDLFEFIVTEEIKGVVFLSGDEHLSCVASATLSKPGKNEIKIASVHASGLYAPFPFANARRQDFIDGLDDFPTGGIHCSAMTQFVPAGNNFTTIEVKRVGSQTVVSAEFIVAGERLRTPDVFSGKPLCRSAAFPTPLPDTPPPSGCSRPAAPAPP